MNPLLRAAAANARLPASPQARPLALLLTRSANSARRTTIDSFKKQKPTAVFVTAVFLY